MSQLKGRTAIVVGASSGVGRAAAKALVAAGARVVAVARGAEGLAALSAEVPEGLTVHQGDAAESAEALVREFRPDVIVHAGGVRPRTATIDEQTWESFSETWNSDTRAAFLFTKTAVTLPLKPGSTVVLVSSGAAINGSPLSGGYAGAKRMQWWLAGYAQKLSDARGLGIRFLAVLPKQLIAGTKIADVASAAYGASMGISGPEFMKKQYEVPLDVDKVAVAIMGALRGEVARDVTAIAVTGSGVESLG